MGLNADMQFDPETIATTINTAGMPADVFNKLGANQQREAQRKFENKLAEHQKKVERRVNAVEVSAEIFQVLDSVATRLNKKDQLLDDKPDRLTVTLSSPLNLGRIGEELPEFSQFLYESNYLASQSGDSEFVSTHAILKGIVINQERPGKGTLEYVLGDTTDPSAERRIGIKVDNKDNPDETVLGATWRNEKIGIDKDATDRTDYRTKEYVQMARACREAKRYIEHNANNQFMPVTLTSAT